MGEYIEREAAKDVVTTVYCDTPDINLSVEKFEHAINSIPAADVAPVVHSYWEHKIANDGEKIGICHNCKYPVSWFWEQTKYCPHCGAKMDGGADNV